MYLCGLIVGILCSPDGKLDTAKAIVEQRSPRSELTEVQSDLDLRCSDMHYGPFMCDNALEYFKSILLEHPKRCQLQTT